MKRQELVRPAMAAAVTVAAVVGYWWLRAPEATFVKAGRIAPDLELPSLGGPKARLSSFRGRPVLLVFFLSGCHICEAELPQIERLHREFLQRGLNVVGVAVDTQEATVKDFVQRHLISFPVLLDPDAAELRRTFHSYKMPEAYLIDPTGTVDTVWVGSVNWWGRDVRERVQRLLPPPRPEIRVP